MKISFIQFITLNFKGVQRNSFNSSLDTGLQNQIMFHIAEIKINHLIEEKKEACTCKKNRF